jgi:predicted metal-dependent phosphoesterase TrpH
MLKCYRADLHIHTCLSPCAEVTMSPRRILLRARRKKLDMIGICDHNSAENVRASVAAAASRGVAVLPGMEVTTREEVHVLALFDEVAQALELQAAVYARLAPGVNDEKLFGLQVVANEFDEVDGFNSRLLIASTDLNLRQTAEKIRGLGGLAVASHVDREAYGIIGQLGFIPDDLSFDALEVSPRTTPAQARKDIPGAARASLIASSDAHKLSDIGRAVTEFLIAGPTVAELRRAFKSERGRRILTEDGLG